MCDIRGSRQWDPCGTAVKGSGVTGVATWRGRRADRVFNRVSNQICIRACINYERDILDWQLRSPGYEESGV